MIVQHGKKLGFLKSPRGTEKVNQHMPANVYIQRGATNRRDSYITLLAGIDMVHFYEILHVIPHIRKVQSATGMLWCNIGRPIVLKGNRHTNYIDVPEDDPDQHSTHVPFPSTTTRTDSISSRNGSGNSRRVSLVAPQRDEKELQAFAESLMSASSSGRRERQGSIAQYLTNKGILSPKVSQITQSSTPDTAIYGNRFDFSGSGRPELYELPVSPETRRIRSPILPKFIPVSPNAGSQGQRQVTSPVINPISAGMLRERKNSMQHLNTRQQQVLSPTATSAKDCPLPPKSILKK